ncbi:MAG: glutathione S-transferase [Methylophilaceae bacterium]|jgi:glutathione S-transferase
MTAPVLYSYRRCPYAMRARMALQYAGIDVEIREISFSDKPKHLLSISPKGTVPVLVLSDTQVIDESLDIIYWALDQQDVDGWLSVDVDLVKALIAENDVFFKASLDAYKYPERNPEKTQVEHRASGEVFLQQLEAQLEKGGGLFGELPTLADIAIFPFVRQFRGVDIAWFEASPYSQLNVWLTTLIESELFDSVMQKHPTYIE